MTDWPEFYISFFLTPIIHPPDFYIQYFHVICLLPMSQWKAESVSYLDKCLDTTMKAFI